MKIIAGNWKMNYTSAQGAQLISRLKNVETTDTVIVCVPFTSLAACVLAAEGSKIRVGAQNIHWAESGAFTGEVSAEMIKETGAVYAIVGHSERRQFFGETDQTVLKRALAAIKNDIIPIVCIGETLEERERGETKLVLSRQIREGFKDISAEMMKRVIVAYEPVWAIGTGRTATSADANETIGYARGVFAELFGNGAAANLPILYGGSVNEKNARELFSMKEIDGGLVGGASLDATKFIEIINSAKI